MRHPVLTLRAKATAQSQPGPLVRPPCPDPSGLVLACGRSSQPGPVSPFGRNRIRV